MGLLARAEGEHLACLFRAIDHIPQYEILRGPENGIVMVRGRAGGSGLPFNLGEMSVTRCTVRTASGGVGHAYVQGRRPEHAERAAVIDALLQDEMFRNGLIDRIVSPLAQQEAEQREARVRESEATKVDFSTLVRGEDQ